LGRKIFNRGADEDHRDTPRRGLGRRERKRVGEKRINSQLAREMTSKNVQIKVKLFKEKDNCQKKKRGVTSQKKRKEKRFPEKGLGEEREESESRVEGTHGYWRNGFHTAI